MRGVSANLFEINQAKSRINAAKANGIAPSPDDVALAATMRYKAFAIAQLSEVVNIEKFAKHIADHGCVYSRADIAAVLYMAVDCLREQLLEGKKVRLGDLGDFSISLTSKGCESADKFTAQNITGLTVVWECGKQFKNLLADAEFKLVPTRNAQAAALKAMKAGEIFDDPDMPDGDDGNDGGGNDGGSVAPDDGGSADGSGSDFAGESGSDSENGSAGGNGSGSGLNPFEDE